MALRVYFAEQNTGIVTTTAGDRAIGSLAPLRTGSMHDALAAVRSYLLEHPDHEAWIGGSIVSHRIIPPPEAGFDAWYSGYLYDGTLEPIREGLDYGELVSTLGWPDASADLGKSPLEVTLRYGPDDVDFHFNAEGRLWLVYRDSSENPGVILQS